MIIQLENCSLEVGLVYERTCEVIADADMTVIIYI